MLIRVEALRVDGIDIGGQLYLPDSQSRCPVVIVCHGIPARVPEPGERGYAMLAERVCRENLGAFIFNFRGTGVSGGNFDIVGWAEDLKAVIDHVWGLPELDRSRLSLFGFSGGAAVSVYVAAQDSRISALVTCACPADFNLAVRNDAQSLIERFRSLGIIRDGSFPSSVEEWLSGFSVISPISYISRVAPRPLLLVHGSEDELVPVGNAYRLYDKAGEPKKLAIVDGAGHRLRQSGQAMAIVMSWLRATLTSNREINYNQGA